MVNNSTLTRINGCISAISDDEGKCKCQVGVRKYRHTLNQMYQCFMHMYTYIMPKLGMFTSEYDEFEQVEWVLGQTRSVVQEMETAVY